MEELVNTLAELQAKRKYAEGEAESASMDVDEMIRSVEIDLIDLKRKREELRKPHLEVAQELQTTIDNIQQAIIEEWDGEKKTLRFKAGTLKFRTSQSLVIENDRLVLEGLLAHTSAKDVATNYIAGFKKTAVKKFMGVLPLPMGAAWIDLKTTVKLEES